MAEIHSQTSANLQHLSIDVTKMQVQQADTVDVTASSSPHGKHALQR
jgi:hypothetical protein